MNKTKLAASALGLAILAPAAWAALPEFNPAAGQGREVLNAVRGMSLNAAKTQSQGQAAEAAPNPPAADSQAADEDRRIALIQYIDQRAVSENDFDEDAALKGLAQVAGITEIQDDVLRTIFDNSRYNNDFTEDAAFREVLEQPALTQAQAKVLKVLATESEYDNDFEEDTAFAAVVQRTGITEAKAGMLIGIFRNARYENNIDDTNLFLSILGPQ